MTGPSTATMRQKQSPPLFASSTPCGDDNGLVKRDSTLNKALSHDKLETCGLTIVSLLGHSSRRCVEIILRMFDIIRERKNSGHH